MRVRGETVILTALGILGIGDLVLERAGKPLVTDVLRRHRILYFGFVGALSLHVLDVLGPFDPFRAPFRLLGAQWEQNKSQSRAA